VYFGQLRNSRLFAGSDSTLLDSLRLFVWPGTPVPARGQLLRLVRLPRSGDRLRRRHERPVRQQHNDYFYFFALGASDWTDNYAGPQDPAQPDTVFLDHPYESRNFYYLTIATPEQPVPGPPKRIDNTQSGALVDTVGAVTPATFTARAHFEQDLEFQPDATPLTQLVAGVYRRTPEFWEKWFWTSLSSGGTSQFQESVDLPGLEPSLPARLRLRVWGLSLLVANQKPDGVFDHYLDLRFGNTVFQRAGWDSLRPRTFDSTVTGLGETGNTLVATPVPNAEADPPYAQTRVDRTGIAWFDVFYPRHFVPVANALTFDSDRAGGKYVYEIGPFTAAGDSIRVFDVTDPYAPAEILGSEILTGPGGRFMRFNRIESGRHRYRIIPTYPGNEQILKPPNNDVFDAPVSGNLRAGLRADYLVIYYDPFKAAADTLVAWRQQRLPIAGTSPPYEAMGVPISAIYDQFSGGRTDPGAIRNFLRAAFYNWSKPPVFVTLLGDASSDYKILTGGRPARTARSARALLREQLRLPGPAPVRDRRLDAQRGRSGARRAGLPRRTHPRRECDRCAGVPARQAVPLRADGAVGGMAGSRHADRRRQHARQQGRPARLEPHDPDRQTRHQGNASGNRSRLRLPPHLSERRELLQARGSGRRHRGNG
jgi:hypothetical protein